MGGVCEERETISGGFSVWGFFFSEHLGVGGVFLSFFFSPGTHVELFDISQLTLNRSYGFANTLVLVTSSYFVARATQSIKSGNGTLCGHWLSGALGLGVLFLALKLMEFHQDFAHGITLSTNLFYMFYLSLTVFHFMHVVMGEVILSVVAYKAYTGRYSAENHAGVETGGSYWHMVDLVWIILFALVYVIH